MLDLPEDDRARCQLVASRLRTSVIGDILDILDRRHQFLDAGICAVTRITCMAGRADPILIGDAFGPQPRPFGKLTEALDDLQPGDVYLARAARTPCAAWGELLTAAARVRKASGAVIDGYHRDTRQIEGQDWPVFSRGALGQDAAVRSTVLDYRVPIILGSVHVSPGDLVVGDLDGVVVVPREIEDEVLERALKKVELEQEVRTAIESGVSTTEAFALYGVL